MSRLREQYWSAPRLRAKTTLNVPLTSDHRTFQNKILIKIKNVHLTSIMPQGHQRYESQGVQQIFFEKVVGGQPKAFTIIYAHQWLTIIMPQGHQRYESQGVSSPGSFNQVQKQGIYLEQVGHIGRYQPAMQVGISQQHTQLFLGQIAKIL